MQQTMKEKVSWYTMKMRIYPSAEQAKQFDRFFLALQLAYNMTFHEVFLKNPKKRGYFGQIMRRWAIALGGKN